MHTLQRLFIIFACIGLACSDMMISLTGNCTYVISIDSSPWLYSGPTRFQANGHHHSTADETLKLTRPPDKGHGVDTLGPFVRQVYTWKAGNADVQTAIKLYDDIEAIVFSQVFVSGITGSSVGDMNSVISAFPSFLVGSEESHIGWMTYNGLFIGWQNLKFGRWTSTARLPGGIESGPLVLFDKQNNVVIISPFSQFMAASYAQNQSSLDWGIMGDVNDIPVGYQSDTIVYYSKLGINKAMEGWGNLLRKWYKRTTAAREMDLSVNYIGYYTDNGAYYYNYPEPGMNYEQTMQAIVKDIHKHKIPYRYIQLDDWWYPIKGPGYGATITWTADPKVFPHGLQYIYNMTQLPVVAHNRYWSSITPYAKQNGGQFNFILDGSLSLPDDQAFWDYLMAGAKEWGMIVYEQDWLNKQVEKIDQLHKDITLGHRWLHQMGEAATRYGLQIQYCMALPRHLLASLEVPAVSQIRASIDYHLKPNQWTIGVTSIFAHALGVAPFKDNLWTTSVQPHNKYNQTEPNPLLQMTVALLSTGPVGVGDRVGYTDPHLIQRVINADGLLLKPSKPAMAIDRQMLQLAYGDESGPDGEVWSTYSFISNFFFGIFFSPQLSKKYIFRPEDMGIPNRQYAVYSYTFNPEHDVPEPFDDSHPLMLCNCTYDKFCMYYASPIIMFQSQPLVILGELSKLVHMSPQRVISLQYATDDVSLTIKGKPGELVTFYFRYAVSPVKIQCTISGLGTAVISWAKQSCH